MIDFHSHIIPGIDDGSRNIDETMQLLEEASKIGFDGVVLTSHYIENFFESDEKQRSDIMQNIQEALKRNNKNIKLYIGNENYLSNNLINLIKGKKASSINNSRYVLFEMPLTIEKEPMNLTDVIYNLQGNKFVPVLAHPERYTFVKKNPKIVYDLVDMGVLMQSNYGSILGQYGKRTEVVAKILLKNNLVHFLGSDVHRANSVYKRIPEALYKIEKMVGEEKLSELTTINPQLAINNKEIDFELPSKFEVSFMDKMSIDFKNIF